MSNELLREARDALRWALPLAERALDSHRLERCRAGHGDITGTFKNGEKWAGIYQSEVDQIETARSALAKLDAALAAPQAPDDGPDGMLALALAVKEGKWPHTMDAREWAKAFMAQFPDMAFDEADAVTWFANAIMAGYDTARARAAPQTTGDSNGSR